MTEVAACSHTTDTTIEYTTGEPPSSFQYRFDVKRLMIAIDEAHNESVFGKDVQALSVSIDLTRVEPGPYGTTSDAHAVPLKGRVCLRTRGSQADASDNAVRRARIAAASARK